MALGIPRYFEVIREPMDLGTVERKLLGGEYATAHDFASDVRLIFANSVAFNSVDQTMPVYVSTVRDDKL